MSPETLAVVLASGLFVGLLAGIELGYRLGRRPRREEAPPQGLGPVEGAVFGLLGLLLAFTFSGAADRFNHRRLLVVDEGNAIGTAWMRVDVLPKEAQPSVRDAMRRYVDARIAMYEAFPDPDKVKAEQGRAALLQAEVWSRSLEASAGDPGGPRLLLLPALNEMFDVASTRTAALFAHTSPVIIGLMLFVALLSAGLAGHAMSASARRPVAHAVLFAAILAATMYVIVDLDYPRFGFIRLDSFDRILVEVREGMR